MAESRRILFPAWPFLICRILTRAVVMNQRRVSCVPASPSWADLICVFIIVYSHILSEASASMTVYHPWVFGSSTARYEALDYNMARSGGIKERGEGPRRR
jgi:hypothetical protein